ncbi:nitrogenase-associated protein [Azospirillum sp. OGB3]|uniref:ArsC/Spx/MgsR family protein n=1 Tax=Azospirillum sp. OGB3 TaxID=2587012 RepID=UPI001605D83D|nr:ArsC/Spx/MgsR family protein [Azospirillum sp. OGB3]MBB3266404.1 nitrogenase-associated protein [Azospirillum sp. OGB3]
MADVIFFEKPGCAGNNRQKALLAEAGHTVHARDLLSEPWTADRLRPFFGDRPVAEWFNRAAPAVKNGEVNPDALDEAAALALMLKTPLLIRRPLMQVGDRRDCGFEAERVDAWIGLAAGAPGGKLEGCARAGMPPCPPPAKG